MDDDDEAVEDYRPTNCWRIVAVRYDSIGEGWTESVALTSGDMADLDTNPEIFHIAIDKIVGKVLAYMKEGPPNGRTS